MVRVERENLPIGGLIGYCFERREGTFLEEEESVQLIKNEILPISHSSETPNYDDDSKESNRSTKEIERIYA